MPNPVVPGGSMADLTGIVGAPLAGPVAGPSAMLDEQTRRWLEQILRPRPALAAPPAALASSFEQAQQRAPFQTGPFPTPGAGREAFLYNLGASIQNAVAGHKEKQIQQALVDYEALGQAWERAQMQGGQDEQQTQQAFQQDPITQAILGDPKKMKNIARSFQQDWLNPEKATVGNQALQRYLKATEAKGMIGALKQLIGRRQQQQPQMTGQMRQDLVRAEAQVLPKQIVTPDPKTVVALMTGELRAQQEQMRTITAQLQAQAAVARNDMMRDFHLLEADKWEKDRSLSEQRLAETERRNKELESDKKEMIEVARARLGIMQAGESLRTQALKLRMQSATGELPTTDIKTRAQFSRQLLPKIPDLERLTDELDKKGMIGPGKGLVSDLIYARAGFGAADYARYRTEMHLLASGLARAHFGGRAGVNALAYFDSLFGGVNASAENLHAILREVQETLETYAAAVPGMPPSSTDAPPAGAKVRDFTDFK